MLLFAFLYLALFLVSAFGVFLAVDIQSGYEFDPKRNYYLVAHGVLALCALWGEIEVWRCIILK